MKLFTFCFVLFAANVVLGQSTCPCNFPEAGSTCQTMRESGLGTCTLIPTPCTQCSCDENGPFTCTVAEDVRLLFNGTGNACSLQLGERVTCPNVKPGVFTTCCRLQGEGSSDDVPCTLQNWRDFVVGGDLAAIRSYIQTNATLDYIAINRVVSTPGLAVVTYDSGWTFQIPAAQPLYFQDFQAFSYFKQINIPAGQASLQEVQDLSDTEETLLPIANQVLFNDIKAKTGPLTFSARYQGITTTSNVPTIISRFTGNACYEYTIVLPS